MVPGAEVDRAAVVPVRVLMGHGEVRDDHCDREEGPGDTPEHEEEPGVDGRRAAVCGAAVCGAAVCGCGLDLGSPGIDQDDHADGGHGESLVFLDEDQG